MINLVGNRQMIAKSIERYSYKISSPITITRYSTWFSAFRILTVNFVTRPVRFCILYEKLQLFFSGFKSLQIDCTYQFDTIVINH
jgi:hypothetical protein